MPHHTPDIAALIGSRICHDLISPVGAVANGMELLQLSGDGDRPEVTLISDSAANANARIRLFRLAFGIASEDQLTATDEIRGILSAIYAGGRVLLDWQASGSVPRREARAVTLAILCAEHALPFGGRLSVKRTGGHWKVSAETPRLRADPALWDILAGAQPAPDVPPSAVQFLLLPHHLSEMGRLCTTRQTQDVLELSF